MPTIIISTNAAAPQTLIPDLGFYVPGGGASLTFTKNDELHRIGNSRDTLALATDDAYGVVSSTLILNDGLIDIDQADVQDFLAHRDQVGKALHADASYTLDGFMPFTDKHWANHAFDSGWVTGGALTYGGGLNVNIAAGEGMLNDAADHNTEVQLVSWGATSVAATPGFNWIYIDSAGVAQTATAHPVIGTAVVLGVCWAEIASLHMLSHALPSSLQQERGNIGEFLEEVVGGAATEGLDVTENATPLHLDVSAGEFFISGKKYTSTSQTDITWTYWYRDGAGGWIPVSGVSALDTTHWDDGTGVLATLPANRYKKDVLHICMNGSGVEFHMVYAQLIHQTQSQAATGLNPLIGKPALSYIARVAGGVVQGSGSLLEIVPEKPTIGQNNPASAARERTLSRFVPILSSSSFQTSDFGRQIVVPIASNGGANISVPIPGELNTLVEARLVGIPTAAAAGAARDIDFWTDYGGIGESPTTHQESDLVSTYDLTGTAGLITVVKDLSALLTNVSGGDQVGVEIKHNSIGGPIEYLGVELIYTVVF